MKNFKKFGIMSLLFIFFAAPAQAKEPIYQGLFDDEAISGYDTVAYFKEGKPVKGSSDHKTKWRGATWKFSSAANLELFKANPEKYAPQYGGYCAWAIADGNFAEGNPKFWEIYNGKLYLNYNEGVQKKWEADKDGFISKGDKKYPELVDFDVE